MIDNPLSMLKGLVALAPDLNLRVCLFAVIDFVDRNVGDEQPSTLDLLDVISQTLVSLHHHVGSDTKGCPFDIDSVKGNNVTEADIAEFKRVLGLMPETDNEEGK
jgi:hypothetical protein